MKHAKLLGTLTLMAAGLLLAACACALDDEDRAAGKPPLWQCFAANSVRAVACRTKTTDNEECPQIGR